MVIAGGRETRSAKELSQNFYYAKFEGGFKRSHNKKFCEVSAAARGSCVSGVCALVGGALGLCPPAFGLCASSLPSFSSPTHRPVSAPFLPCAGSEGFVLP